MVRASQTKSTVSGLNTTPQSLPRQHATMGSTTAANDDDDGKKEYVANNATKPDNAEVNSKQRAGLEFDDDQMTEDLGPASVREGGSGYMALYFNISAEDHRLLEAIATERGESVGTVSRKILEHKITKAPEAAFDTSKVRVRVAVSEQTREEIDRSTEGQSMKKSEFITHQISSYLASLKRGKTGAEPPPPEVT